MVLTLLEDVVSLYSSKPSDYLETIFLITFAQFRSTPTNNLFANEE